MTPFLLYIARAGLYLGLFYAFYLLVMRRTTFFRLNRVLLLCGSFLCLVLPFFRLRSVVAAGIASELSMVAGAETVQEAVRTAFRGRSARHADALCAVGLEDKADDAQR